MSELTTIVKSCLPSNLHTAGEIGLEIEVEGENLCKKTNLSYWNVHEDGSLRGENAEYVLKKPVSRERVPVALNYLNKKLEESLLHFSHRCSTHVHINAQEMTGLDLYKWITMYAIFEGILMEYCGEHRKGNLFCLSMADSQAIVDSFREAVIRKRHISYVNAQEHMRYAALNAASLGKFGSLEFRALYGTVDPSIILPWIDVLLAIRDKSQEFSTPIHIIEAVSLMGIEEFTRGILSPVFMQRIPSTFSISRSINQGTWLAQEFAFQDTWSLKLKKKLEESHESRDANLDLELAFRAFGNQINTPRQDLPFYQIYNDQNT